MKSLHSTHYLMSFLMMALSFNIAHGTSSITLIDAVLEKDNQRPLQDKIVLTGRYQ